MRVKHLILISLFAGLTAIGTFIRIPIAYVPFTLQIVSVYLSGALLGARNGMYSQLLYITMGLLGLPIFTEGGGIYYIFKPTFGYLLGYIVGAFLVGYIIVRMSKVSFWKVLMANLASLLVVYLIGCVWLYGSMNWFIHTTFSIEQTFLYGFLIPIPGDLLLCILCAIITVRLTSNPSILLPTTRKLESK